jgi:hypothetical protein
VVYLCSEANPYTHEVFSAGGGRYARFFIGLNQGWFAGQKVLPAVEEIADRIDTIRDLGDYRVLNSATEELQMLGSILAGGG